MLNQVSIVGKVQSAYRIDNDYYVLLEVKRNFKDFDGEFKSDFVKCKIWKGKANSIIRLPSDETIISVVGRLNCDNGETYYVEAYDIDFLGK